MPTILHKFHHGLGDAVMFTAVLAHLKKEFPDRNNHVKCLKGKHSAFKGVAEKSFFDDPTERYDSVQDHDWPECHHMWSDGGTKTVQCLRQKYYIKTDWDKLKYVVPIDDEAKSRADQYFKSLPEGKKVLIHYQGNTSTEQKNLSHTTVRQVCDLLIEKGYAPVILDWDRRSPIPDNKTVFCPDADHPLWMGYGTGDAETIAALIEQSVLFIGIDSGPCKVAYSVESTPCITVWIGHHPVHFCDNAPNAFHLVPKGHRELIRGDYEVGMKFFDEHYKYETYFDLTGSLKAQIAKTLGFSFNPMPEAAAELLTATAFAEDYYQEHKRAGLDYLDHGGWQENYGRWMVNALGLRGRTMLDVGCACGSIACGFGKAGALVSGCDVNEQMIVRGRQKWLRDNLFICDASNLHYWKDGTFDFIHSAQVFEHFKPELVPFILRELYRVTKPGGIMFAAFDTTEMYARQGRDLATEDATHQCVKPMAFWDQQLADTGWVHDPGAAAALKNHPDSFFGSYDWDWIMVTKPKEKNGTE